MNRPILGILIVLASCAATPLSPLVKRTYTPVFASSEIVRLPDVAVESEVEIGQSMISTVKRTPNPAIRLSSSLVHRGPYYGDMFTLTLPAGYLLLRGRDHEGRFFQSETAPSFKMDNHTDTIHMKGGIYVPNDRASTPEIYWISTDGKPRNDLDSSLRPSVIEDYALYDDESFKRELVYAGVSQNTISILYREFKDDFARPAFSQDVKYDLAQGNEIGFRGARFKVINATNTGIRYTVLRALD